MTEFPAQYNLNDPESVPVIVVSRVLANDIPDEDYHNARYDDRQLIRRYEVRVRIENVIKGEIRPGDVTVFYFVDGRSYGDSSMPL